MTKAGFVHGFSTRVVGNLSLHHGDPAVTIENRARFLKEIGYGWPMAALKQTHSDTIVMTESAMESETETGDGLVSWSSGLFLGVKTADCVPVLIADPVSKAMAAVHAGWRGTLQRIVEKAVTQLVDRFRVNPENLIAAVGPAACGRCYEVGDDVADNFRQTFSDVRAFLLPSSSEKKFLLNVPAANATQLIRSKLRAENVHLLSYCTMHQSDLFFSHRQDAAAGKPVGRQLSVIGRV